MAASLALAEYHNGFVNKSTNEVFVSYYAHNTPNPVSYSREEIWNLGLSRAKYLLSLNINKGDKFVLNFTDNRIEDLVLRLAAVMIGAVPVTVNWQADNMSKILFKTKITSAKVLFCDEGINNDLISTLRKELGEGVQIVTLSEMNKLCDEGNHHGIQSNDDIINQTVTLSDDRIIIFTSGTTGDPKGVRLSYRAYSTNAETFNSFLLTPSAEEEEKVKEVKLVAFVTNPFHHTNSTSIVDWCLRCKGARLHLFQRYCTRYWSILAATVAACSFNTQEGQEPPTKIAKNDLSPQNLSTTIPPVFRIVAPLVSKHTDFLENLFLKKGFVGVSNEEMTCALSSSILTLLLGSAPVGPSTVDRLGRLCGGKLPVVRFGSTETCLQVLGTPPQLSHAVRLRAFQRGWNHKAPLISSSSSSPSSAASAVPNLTAEGEPCIGYYIGRAHPRHTEVKIVKSVDRDNTDYMKEVEEGEVGLLVTRGHNLMTAYVGDDENTRNALHVASDEGLHWYINLGDVCFWLKNESDGEKDVYWVSRESSLLIRGGANYSYDQVNEELSVWLSKTYQLIHKHDFELAVIGLKLDSEHEDSCCLTIQWIHHNNDVGNQEENVHQNFSIIQNLILDDLKQGKIRNQVSKGACPNYIRFGDIPKNFKGSVLVKELVSWWKSQTLAPS